MKRPPKQSSLRDRVAVLAQLRIFSLASRLSESERPFTDVFLLPGEPIARVQNFDRHVRSRRLHQSGSAAVALIRCRGMSVLRLCTPAIRASLSAWKRR
jgi:hypothetical protein